MNWTNYWGIPMNDYSTLVIISLLLGILISILHLTMMIRKLLNGFVRRIVREELESLKREIDEIKRMIKDENRYNK